MLDISCPLKIPAKISVLCNEADVCSSICCAWENVTNIFLKKKKVVCFAATHGVRSVGSPSLSVSMRIILAFGRPVTNTAGLTAGQTATGTLSVLKKNFPHVHDTSDSPAAGSSLVQTNHS